MAHKSWSFELTEASSQEGSFDDFAPRKRQHTVDLRHNYWTNKRIISVDDVPLSGDRLVSYSNLSPFSQDGWGSDDLFKLDGHECLVHIRSNGLTYRYDFAIDGISLQNGERVVPFPQIATPHLAARRMPAWAWGFVILSFLLPFVAAMLAIALVRSRPFTSAFVTIIVIITMGIVLARSKDLSKETQRRVQECAATVFLAACVSFAATAVLGVLLPR